MGEAFITRRGGSGGGKAFAVIGVTYPAGSVCTCTDGTKTLTLKDTGGQGFFLIPYAATWTVTATDGTNTKSESVEITSEGQSVCVALTYALILFDGETGDNAANFAITWSERNNTKINTNSIVISSTSVSDSSGGVSSADKVDLSKHKTLQVSVKDVNRTGRGVYICLSNTKVSSFDAMVNKDVISRTVFVQSATTAVITVDISAINEPVYIFVGAANTDVTVTDIRGV